MKLSKFYIIIVSYFTVKLIYLNIIKCCLNGNTLVSYFFFIYNFTLRALYRFPQKCKKYIVLYLQEYTVQGLERLSRPQNRKKRNILLVLCD